MKFIATADWHLRLTAPVCRTDDYVAEQWRKVKWVGETARQCGAYILLAGDVFDHWKASPELLTATMDAIPGHVYAIPGQHDLPHHDAKQLNKSGFGVLLDSADIFQPEDHGETAKLVAGAAFGQEPKGKVPVLMLHRMTWHAVAPWKGIAAPSATVLLRKYPWARWIITGDNHKSFAVEHEGRWLINPGSLMRMDADQADYKPSVYYFDTDRPGDKPQRMEIPIAEGVVSRTHLATIEEKNERLEEFVRRLDDGMDVGLSFTDNLTAFMDQNKIGKDVRQIVQEVTE